MHENLGNTESSKSEARPYPPKEKKINLSFKMKRE